ncbi:MAG: methylated-DNA--[protein]-cysteine S-methyltransferase [Phycisphaerales bacterium]
MTAPSPAGRSPAPLATREIDTPLGPMLGAATDGGVCLLEFTDRRALATELRELDRGLGRTPPDTRATADPFEHLDHLSDELSAYFAGVITRFSVPLVPAGSAFERGVWDLLMAIPYGRTTSYGAIARQLGQPGASRAVGRANGRNRIAIVIPCHRVIDSSGGLHGYGGGLHRKRYLLELEMTFSGAGSLWPPALAGAH